ncbi:uncharacterized protein LOC129598898 isoform X2 [Paramacrobiotus metropolitanus]|uniref:uncharacterized protein LOC129598898 isoform X2 n=1 Tax=Paramacrobiotus metropolitanus TaxID=2943436 RepID=UPI0024458F7C|nr:uncharacterized protein LOC129598898 isoform X2 [Paramacrobiotus metropolitanus]
MDDCCRLRKVASESHREDGLNADWHGTALPIELLKEIFRSLDTIERQRCRRICQLWDAILTSAEMCHVVHISLEHPPFSPRLVKKWNGNYATYSCIFKHITPAARIICIRAAEWECDNRDDVKNADEAVKLIKKVLNEGGIRIDCLIVHNRSLLIDQGEPGPLRLKVVFATIAAFYSKLATCCGRLIWKNYSLRCERNNGAVLLKFYFPLAVFILGNVEGAHFWDIFEQHLCCGGLPLDMNRIAQWITSCTDKNAKARKIQKVLKDHQSCDPRPSAHYRGNTWTQDALASMDVRRLNTLCFHALWRYVQKWSRTPLDAAREYSDGSSDSEDSSDSDGSTESNSDDSQESDSSSSSDLDHDYRSDAEPNDSTDSDCQ